MRLLFFIYSLSSGGAERVTASLANHWAKKGWQVTILTIAAGADFYELHPAVHRVSLDMASRGGNSLMGLWNNLRRISMLRRVLKQVRPNVALSVMDTANVLLAFATLGMSNISSIGSERTYLERLPECSLWGRLRRWSYSRLTAIVALTHDTKAWLQSNTGARQLTVIPNAIEWPLSLKFKKGCCTSACSV